MPPRPPKRGALHRMMHLLYVLAVHALPCWSLRASDVRIYSYKLPDCSFEHFPAEEIDGTVKNFFHPGRPPTLPLHHILKSNRFSTDDPNNATHFYIPAPFFVWDSSFHLGVSCPTIAFQDSRVAPAEMLVNTLSEEVRTVWPPRFSSGQISNAWSVAFWLCLKSYASTKPTCTDDFDNLDPAWPGEKPQQPSTTTRILVLPQGVGTFGLQNGCPILCSGSGAANTAGCDAASLRDGRWHHVVISSSLHNVSLFIDSVKLDLAPAQQLHQILCDDSASIPPEHASLVAKLHLRKKPVGNTFYCQPASPDRSPEGRCFRLVRRFVEDQPWLQRGKGWNHITLFGSADYPSAFDPTGFPSDNDFVLENAWPAFKNFLVLHLGARTERCFRALAFADGKSPAKANCLRRFFQTITIPPYLPGEQFSKRAASNPERRYRVGYRGLAYPAMPERMAFLYASQEGCVAELMARNYIYLEFTNWTLDLYKQGVCLPRMAFDRLCPWEDVKKSWGLQATKSRSSNMKSKNIDLWASSDFGLSLPGDGGYELRLYSMINQGAVPVIAFDLVQPKIPFTALLPWHQFAVLWPLRTDADASILAQDDETNARALTLSAHQILSQLSMASKRTVRKKRSHVLQYACAFQWPGTSPDCTRTAMDMLVMELALRQRHLGDSLHKWPPEYWDKDMVLANLFLKIPQRHTDACKTQDLTGTGCPLGFPSCDPTAQDGDVCRAETLERDFACPLGCVRSSERPLCRDAGGVNACRVVESKNTVACGADPWYQRLLDGSLSSTVVDLGMASMKFVILTESIEPELEMLMLPALQHFTESFPGRYTLIVERQDILDPRDWHPTWNKIVFLRRALKVLNCHYVIWISGDILLTNPSIDMLASIIAQMNEQPKVQVALSEDDSKKQTLGTSLIIVKQTRAAARLLDSFLLFGQQRHVLKRGESLPRLEGDGDRTAIGLHIHKFGTRKLQLVPHRVLESAIRPTSHEWRPGDWAARFTGYTTPAERLRAVQNFLQGHLP